MQAEAQLAHAQNDLSSHLAARGTEGVPDRVCPVCRQPVNEEHRTKLHREHREKEAALSQEVRKWLEEREMLGGALQERRRHLALLEEQQASVDKSLQVCFSGVWF